MADWNQILTELRQQLEVVEECIVIFERLAAVSGKTKRRGRPPKWLAAVRKEQAKGSRLN